MNYRQRQLRKFYMAFSVPVEFIWYTNENLTQTTLKYYGSKASVKVPQLLGGVQVTELECTTFCDNKTITDVSIQNGVTKIN